MGDATERSAIVRLSISVGASTGPCKASPLQAAIRCLLKDGPFYVWPDGHGGPRVTVAISDLEVLETSMSADTENHTDKMPRINIGHGVTIELRRWPDIHPDAGKLAGGCGHHGFIREGKWVPA